MHADISNDGPSPVTRLRYVSVVRIADLPVPQIPLPNADLEHVARVLTPANIISARLLHSLQANLTRLSNASSSAAADATATTAPDALAPSDRDELNESSSFAVILGVAAFIILIGTYPWWKKLLGINDDESSITNSIPTFVKMNVVSTTGSHPISGDNEAFWSADVGTHDRMTSNTTQGSMSSHEQSLPFPRRFRQEREPTVQYLSM
jgi:hypothetical protein